MILQNKNLLSAIANCGIMTKNIAKSHYKIYHKTLNSLLKNDFLVIKGNLILFGKATTIFTLSESSKNIFRKLGKSPYRTNSSQLEHDYLLLRSYSVLPIATQSSWLNETELKELYNSDATTDGLFYFKNKKIGIEVITPNYTHEMIKKKIEFGQTYCDELITMDTSQIKID
ncbi:hypothetical protein [uncultured Clostridium sp.]|uniref:hypothetical protein n=1 Tax=uncultured Clostridium sp. TaxID=59620 RepID=UPI0028EC3E2F|nr:hypothetical protein [uncultured Clostridium sp.]